MMHEDPVMALSFSRDAELLASASTKGEVKVGGCRGLVVSVRCRCLTICLQVWRILSGACVRKFPAAHSASVTCRL